MNDADTMHAPRIDPFTAEAEHMPAATDDSEFAALRAAVSAARTRTARRRLEGTMEPDPYQAVTKAIETINAALRDVRGTFGPLRTTELGLHASLAVTHLEDARFRLEFIALLLQAVEVVGR